MATYNARIIQINDDGTLVAVCTSPDDATPPRVTIALADMSDEAQKCWAVAIEALENAYVEGAKKAELSAHIARAEAELKMLREQAAAAKK